MLQLPSRLWHRSRPVPNAPLHLASYESILAHAMAQDKWTSGEDNTCAEEECAHHNNGQDDWKHLKNAHPARQCPS